MASVVPEHSSCMEMADSRRAENIEHTWPTIAPFQSLYSHPLIEDGPGKEQEAAVGETTKKRKYNYNRKKDKKNPGSMNAFIIINSEIVNAKTADEILQITSSRTLNNVNLSTACYRLGTHHTLSVRKLFTDDRFKKLLSEIIEPDTIKKFERRHVANICRAAATFVDSEVVKKLFFVETMLRHALTVVKQFRPDETAAMLQAIAIWIKTTTDTVPSPTVLSLFELLVMRTTSFLESCSTHVIHSIIIAIDEIVQECHLFLLPDAIAPLGFKMEVSGKRSDEKLVDVVIALVSLVLPTTAKFLHALQLWVESKEKLDVSSLKQSKFLTACCALGVRPHPALLQRITADVENASGEILVQIFWCLACFEHPCPTHFAELVIEWALETWTSLSSYQIECLCFALVIFRPRCNNHALVKKMQETLSTVGKLDPEQAKTVALATYIVKNGH